MTSGGARKLSENCENVCENVCSLKCVRLRKELFPPHSVNTRRSPRLWAVWSHCHTGYSRVALAGNPNDQATKAAMSVPECVENYSKNLTLVALHKSEGTPFNSDVDHPVSTVWCSL